jgi:uncharacterized membrane protein YeaQ/YmgE (transglycosylase-associated protein family)
LFGLSFCDLSLRDFVKFVLDRYPKEDRVFENRGENLMSLIIAIVSWIIFGVIAGAIAKMITPGPQGGGFWQTAALGIAGSFIGGAAHNLIKYKSLATTAPKHLFSLGSIALAVIGAIVVIFLWGLVMNKSKQ